MDRKHLALAVFLAFMACSTAVAAAEEQGTARKLQQTETARELVTFWSGPETPSACLGRAAGAASRLKWREGGQWSCKHLWACRSRRSCPH